MQSVTDFGAVPNPLNATPPFVDSYAAFQAAANTGKPVLIPAGVGAFYLSQPVTCLTDATNQFKAGMKFIGEDRDNSIVWSGVTSPYNNDAAFKWDVPDTTGERRFTVDSELSCLSLLPAPGVAARRALSLTAAWYVKCDRLHIEGFTEHGVVVPWRADINPTLSDPYQCLRLSFTDPYVRGCSGHGFVFGAGQSPGLWEIIGGEIRLNAGSGVVTSTGQFLMRNVIVAENHAHGLDIDPTLGSGISREGPAMVGEVVGCEFDTNGQYQLIARYAQDTIIRGNRFVTAPTAQYARHIILGLNGFGACTGALCENNYHRSTGSNEVYAYLREPGSNNNRIINPFYGPSSSGMTKYFGFAVGQGNLIIENNTQIVGP